MKQRSSRQPLPVRKTAAVDFVDLAKAVIERVEVLAKTCGPTRAYVAVVASIGLAFLHAIASTRLIRLVPFLIALYLPLHPWAPDLTQLSEAIVTRSSSMPAPAATAAPVAPATHPAVRACPWAAL